MTEQDVKLPRPTPTAELEVGPTMRRTQGKRTGLTRKPTDAKDKTRYKAATAKKH